MWSKEIVEWTEDKKAYLSVVFTWQLHRYMRYWSKQAYLAGIPFRDYRG